MSCRGPGFHVVECLAPPPPSPVSKLDRRQFGYGKGGSWWGKEPNQEAWSSVNDFILAALDREAKLVNFENFRRIMHGDLAARNILVGENYTAKISDFGLSKMMYYNQGL